MDIDADFIKKTLEKPKKKHFLSFKANSVLLKKDSIFLVRKTNFNEI